VSPALFLHKDKKFFHFSKIILLFLENILPSTMTIQQAIDQLINSESFKEKAKEQNAEGSKYRMFLARYKKKELKNGAAVDMLLQHGYDVSIKKGKGL
jgi:hypothetical protein